uniref:Uncharacterized protein n=1 Tax=Peronospora matthiolae TaxID=2874970 RepID=A0AAV1V368_9STRA
MQLTSQHEAGIQNYHSSQSPEYNDDATVPSYAAKDFESPVAETDTGLSLHGLNIYGTLRKGDPAKFSPRNVPVSIIFLNVAKLAASQRLISMRSTFCFFFGLLSDGYPIVGFRRKAQLIISLVSTVVSYFALLALNAHGESLKRGTNALD